MGLVHCRECLCWHLLCPHEEMAGLSCPERFVKYQDGLFACRRSPRISRAWRRVTTLRNTMC